MNTHIPLFFRFPLFLNHGLLAAFQNIGSENHPANITILIILASFKCRQNRIRDSASARYKKDYKRQLLIGKYKLRENKS